MQKHQPHQNPCPAVQVCTVRAIARCSATKTETRITSAKHLVSRGKYQKPAACGNISECNENVLALRRKVGDFLRVEAACKPPLDNWPESIEVRPDLLDRCKDFCRESAGMGSAKLLDFSTSGNVVQHFFVMHPSSFAHITLDVFSSVLLLVDLTLTPLILAWDVSLRGGLLVYSFTAASFWTGDLCMNFLTAYISEEGSLVTDPLLVIKRYLRRWFVLDFCVVLSDWVSVILGSRSSGNLKLVRFGKLSRLLQILVIIRFNSVLPDVGGSL